MYAVLIFLTALVGILANPYQQLFQEQWEQFKLENGKFYKTEDDERYRRNIYMENLHNITEHNKLYEHGLTTYQMTMNHMGDLTGEEFLRFYTVNMPELPHIENTSSSEPWPTIREYMPKYIQDFYIFAPSTSEEELADLPGDIDWRDKQVVTPVKDQGQCGSCWSFSATGALEAQWRLHKSNSLISLSEQNLVDCSGKYGNLGCSGGWMHWAFSYIKDNGGIDTEESYKYTGSNGNCHYKPANKGASVSKVVLIPAGEAQLQAKVGTVGPISIAAEVSHSFQFYHKGVYNEPNCGHRLNHAMLAVGYASQNGADYWLVKNSWGTGWGDQGYIKMSRNKDNQCGIALMASYPVV